MFRTKRRFFWTKTLKFWKIPHEAQVHYVVDFSTGHQQYGILSTIADWYFVNVNASRFTHAGTLIFCRRHTIDADSTAEHEL